jgi:hypothetical protein
MRPTFHSIPMADGLRWRAFGRCKVHSIAGAAARRVQGQSVGVGHYGPIWPEVRFGQSGGENIAPRWPIRRLDASGLARWWGLNSPCLGIAQTLSRAFSSRRVAAERKGRACREDLSGRPGLYGARMKISEDRAPMATRPRRQSQA